MAALSINNVYKTYANGTDVLKGIDIAIEDGQFLILVGPSGCGKSTLLNMIAGLDDITSGDIVIGNKRVNDLSPKDRDIAMVFQSYALYPSMTVRENISFGLEIRKVPKAEIDATVNRVAEMLQIKHLLERKPGQMSGGQRQRVAMGRALARNPSIFLFDEPLSNLDAKLRVEMRTEIKLMHQRLKTTTVYVTHDQIEAMTLGDKVAVMKDGVIQQFGTLDAHPLAQRLPATEQAHARRQLHDHRFVGDGHPGRELEGPERQRLQRGISGQGAVVGRRQQQGGPTHGRSRGKSVPTAPVREHAPDRAATEDWAAGAVVSGWREDRPAGHAGAAWFPAAGPCA